MVITNVRKFARALYPLPIHSHFTIEKKDSKIPKMLTNGLGSLFKKYTKSTNASFWIRMRMKMENTIRKWTDPSTNSENTSNQIIRNEKKLKWMQLPTNDNGIALNCFCHPLCLVCWCGCMKNSGGWWRFQMMKRSVFLFFLIVLFWRRICVLVPVSSEHSLNLLKFVNA